MNAHDPAECRHAPCVRCADFNAGWTLGKAKAFSEVEEVVPARHAVDCGCRPCQVVAVVILGWLMRRWRTGRRRWIPA